MALSRLFLSIVMVLSTTAIKVDSMYKDCELTSRVMVSWIECSPYIFYAKNSISNTTVFTAKGIFPAALEILGNVSNLTFTYNAPFDSRKSRNKAVEKEHRTGANQIVIECHSINSKKFEENEDEGDGHDVCINGKLCPVAVKITDSYGPVFMTKYEETQSIRLILQGLKQCWKVIVTTLFLACLAGIALWIAERNKNSLEFPREFMSGSWQGFWWALVTMTTVGYGDKVPKSVPGRLVTIVWMIIGMVFFSILTGTMTGVLFMREQPDEMTMFGKRVAVLAESEEAEIAMSQSANVDEYETVADILQAARNDEISFLLLDRFIVHAYLKEFRKHNFKVTKLMDKDTSYFLFVLSSKNDFSFKIANCFKKQKFIIVHKAIQKILMAISNEWSKIEKDETDNIMDNTLIISLAGALAFLFCLGIIWQYLCLKYSVQDTEAIKLAVKKADSKSTYVNTKKEDFPKCSSCRQCKHCNDQIQ